MTGNFMKMEGCIDMINGKDLETMFIPDIWKKLENLRAAYEARHDGPEQSFDYQRAKKSFKLLVEMSKK